jgi:hypothetical protein
MNTDEHQKPEHQIAWIEPFVQSVGALAYYTIIIQCIVISDGGIIPPYNITSIILQLYIWTNSPASFSDTRLENHSNIMKGQDQKGIDNCFQFQHTGTFLSTESNNRGNIS